MTGKKPSYQQRKELAKYGIDTYKWLVQKATSEIFQIVNKETHEVKIISRR